jgi:hypothetical protein
MSLYSVSNFYFNSRVIKNNSSEYRFNLCILSSITDKVDLIYFCVKLTSKINFF